MSIVSLSTWNQFLSTHPNAHLLQTGEWGALKSSFGWEPVRIVSGKVGAQILFRKLPLGFTVGYIPKLAISFQHAMDDDFNSPAALAALQGLRGQVNRLLESGLSSPGRLEARERFRSVGRVLGLFQLSKWQFNPVDRLIVGVEEKAEVRSLMTETDIEANLAERNDARRRKDFKRADEIRIELASLGITIEDRPDGTSRWKR